MSIRKQVWFLTGSQALYGDEILAQVAEQSRGISDLLADSPHVVTDIVVRPVLTSADAIRRVLLDANSDDACIGVITWMHTFSPAKLWIKGLDLLRKPLLHLHTQANVKLPWSTIDMEFMNLNQAAHGDREYAFIATRLGKNRTTVAGHVSNEGVQRRVGAWTRAAMAADELRNLRVCRFGDNMRYVAVTEGDKVEAEINYGVEVNTWGVNDLAEAVTRVGADAVDRLVEEYLDLYDVAPELHPGADRADSLRVAAGIELGLRHFVVDGGFGAFTTNFEDLGALRQLPGLGVQRLMGEGIGFAGEGDWKTAVLGRALNVMSDGLPGGTSFMEDYTYDLTQGSELSLGAHMLEVCPSIAKDKPRIEVHPLFIGNRDDPVRMVFDAKPGDGIIIGMCDLGDRYRWVSNELTVVDPPEPMPRLPIARAVWQVKADWSTATECWLAAGGPHHSVLSTALTTQDLSTLAEIVGTELAAITEATTDSLEFQLRLRWSNTHHRLGK